MGSILLDTEIAAPVELVFDLARDVAVHCATAAFTEERAVGPLTAGLLELGECMNSPQPPVVLACATRSPGKRH